MERATLPSDGTMFIYLFWVETMFISLMHDNTEYYFQHMLCKSVENFLNEKWCNNARISHNVLCWETDLCRQILKNQNGLLWVWFNGVLIKLKV